VHNTLFEEFLLEKNAEESNIATNLTVYFYHDVQDMVNVSKERMKESFPPEIVSQFRSVSKCKYVIM